MHVRDDRVHRLAGTVEPLIRASDVFVGEMEIQGGTLDLQSDSRISEAFSPKAYAKMRRQLLKSFGLDILAFDRVHPLVVSSLLSQRVLAADHAVSLDERLMQMARASGIPVTGLETLQEQVRVLERIDPGPVCRQLRRLATCGICTSDRAGPCMACATLC